MNGSAGDKIILLVEDEAIIAVAQKKLLEKYGYTVITASSGEGALKIFKDNNSINLVLMDIDLGRGMDGPDTARMILEVRDIPVVFLSSHTEPEIVEKTEKITSYGYVVKNSGITVLDASIKMAFKLYEAKVNEKIKEIELGSNQKKFSFLFNAMIEGFAVHEIVCDSNGKPVDYRFLDMNPAFENLTGLKKAEITGKTVKTVLPGIESSWIEKYGRVALTGEHISFENYSGDLKKYYQVVAYSPQKNQFATIFFDITERKMLEDNVRQKNEELTAAMEEMEEANAGLIATNVSLMENEIIIGESEEQYRVLFNNKHYAICIVDIETAKILEINDAFISMYGYSRDDVLSGLTVDVITMEPADIDASIVTAADESVFIPLQYHRKKDGTVFPVEIVAEQYEWKGRRVLFRMSHDITLRKNAEKQFRSLVWDMQVGVLLQGPNAEIQLSNPKALELLGLNEDQLLGKTSFDPDWNVIHEDGSPFPGDTHPVPRAIATRKPVQNVVMGVYRPVANDRVWLLVDAIPVLNSDGSVQQVTCTFINITERKFADDRIKSLLTEKDIILKEVHHRMKNFMNNMQGILMLQSNSQENLSVVSALEDATNRVKSMSLLYDKLFTSYDFTGVSISSYLSSLVDEIVSNFPNSQSVTINKDIDDFIMDVKKLQPIGIIVNELVTNIMKYAFKKRNDGVINVSLKLSGKRISLAIQDNGVGIPESISFENSTGFGMELVSILSSQIGASIMINRDKGTRFVLEFEK